MPASLASRCCLPMDWSTHRGRLYSFSSGAQFTGDHRPRTTIQKKKSAHRSKPHAMPLPECSHYQRTADGVLVLIIWAALTSLDPLPQSPPRMLAAGGPLETPAGAERLRHLLKMGKRAHTWRLPWDGQTYSSDQICRYHNESRKRKEVLPVRRYREEQSQTHHIKVSQQDYATSKLY